MGKHIRKILSCLNQILTHVFQPEQRCDFRRVSEAAMNGTHRFFSLHFHFCVPFGLTGNSCAFFLHISQAFCYVCP